MKKDLPHIIREALANRPPLLTDEDDTSRTHASVLIPLFKRNGEYSVLFTKRTTQVEAHKGQISFPGGRVDEQDHSLVETALREAYEEVGLLREDVDVLGRLDDARTVTSSYIVHPFVGCIPYPYDFKINPHEVNELIEIPFQVFFPDPARSRTMPVEYAGVTYESVAFEYKGDVVWGATARIMENFVQILMEKMDLPQPLL